MRAYFVAPRRGRPDVRPCQVLGVAAPGISGTNSGFRTPPPLVDTAALGRTLITKYPTKITGGTPLVMVEILQTKRRLSTFEILDNQ